MRYAKVSHVMYQSCSISDMLNNSRYQCWQVSVLIWSIEVSFSYVSLKSDNITYVEMSYVLAMQFGSKLTLKDMLFSYQKGISLSIVICGNSCKKCGAFNLFFIGCIEKCIWVGGGEGNMSSMMWGNLINKLKVSKSQNQISQFSFEPKTNVFFLSTLASKMTQLKK